MSLPILRGLLQGYTKSLFDEGVVNDQFNVIIALKRIGEPNHVVQLIETYLADVERILTELLRHEDNQKIDLHKLTSLAREIEDKSTRIGAELVKTACYNVIKACDENHQQKRYEKQGTNVCLERLFLTESGWCNNFSRSLLLLKKEFSSTKNKLTSFVQMEQRIIRFEKSQSPASTSQSPK